MKKFLKYHSPKRKIMFLITLFLIAYIAALIIPYIPHKKVSDSFKNQFTQKTFSADTTGNERVAYITDNTEALICRLKMFEEANKEIILSTFDFNADKSGKDIMSALIKAANRGVKVRIIVDGISGFLDMNRNPYFKALASHENISVKVYNPINLLKPWKIQARLHDKYVITDNSIYLLGGRNTTNLFLGDYSSHKNIDKELLVYENESADNSSIEQLKSYFENVWSLPDSKDYICNKMTDKIQDCYNALEDRYQKVLKLYPDVTKNWDWTSLTVETNKITLLSNPVEAQNKEPHMWYSISQLMQSGNNVIMYTPYIICGKEMYSDLKVITKNGINIDIITNDVTSGANPWGCTDYLNQKKQIWKTGVNVYEYLGSHSSHTKAVLIDENMTILGSYNLDMRSTYQDTELMLTVDSPELNAVIQQEAVHDKTYSKVMTDSGEYKYGENYEPKKMSIRKHIFYFALRILTVPIRRFL